MGTEDYSRFRTRIIITLILFSIVPVLIIGTIIYKQFQTVYYNKLKERIRSVVMSRKNTIDLFLEERLAQLVTLAYSNSYSKMVDISYLEYLFSFIQRGTKYFVDIGVIDEYGNHIAYYGPYRLHNVNYREEEWFKKVLVQGTYISDVFLGFRGIPHFIIAVLRYEGNKMWILRATIDSDVFEKLVRTAYIGKTGNAYIINPQGVLQTKPRFFQGVLERKEGLDIKALAQAGSVMEVEGENSILMAMRLETKDWYLVLEQDLEQEMEPFLKKKGVAFALAFAGVILVLVGIVIVSRQMVWELIRRERDRAQIDANLVQSSKLAALGKLAAGIAHEINNPLSVILEKAGWMKDLLEEEDISNSKNFQELLSSVNKIEEHVERARKVTHRLLGFARKMEPVDEEVDLIRIMEDTISFLEVETKFKNIKVHREYAPNLPMIRSDSSQLQQVFLNILENAVDAVSTNGNIWVMIGADDNNSVRIEIADDGPGISDLEKKKVFDPFYTTKPMGNGTGLGLSVSYSIVRKLGGDIRVKDNKPKGALFEIVLPLRRLGV